MWPLHLMEHGGNAVPLLKTPESTNFPCRACRALIKVWAGTQILWAVCEMQGEAELVLCSQSCSGQHFCITPNLWQPQLSLPHPGKCSAGNVLQWHKIQPALQDGKPAEKILQPCEINCAEQRDMHCLQSLGPHQAHRGSAGKRRGNLKMAEAFIPQEPGGGKNTMGILHTVLVFAAMESSCGSGMGSEDCTIPSYYILHIITYYILITYYIFPHGTVSPVMTTLCYLEWSCSKEE